MSRVTIHIQRVVVSSPDFDESTFANAVREQVAAMVGPAARGQQIGSLTAPEPASQDAKSVGSAVGKAIGRSLQ